MGRPASTGTVDAVTRRRGRVLGLDGVRGLAALFVVLHHCWLLSFPGYPANTGPAWTTPLVYGHLAVVVFIVLSGFSLAVSPARADWRLGSKARFARRRAWRILPPYWAALAVSLVVAWAVVTPPGSAVPTARSVLVHALLLQDIIGSPTPNGAFWSIAVEAQLYVVFPLLLLSLRRFGWVAMTGAVALVVVAVGLVAPSVPVVGLLMRLTPQFAALFALGVAAAGIVRAGDRVRGLPWSWLAALCALPVLLVVSVRGPVWTVAHYFWVDLALGPAVALLLVAVATRRPRPFVRLLDTRAVRSLGAFSYSLYLIHAPIVGMISVLLVARHVTAGVPTLLATLALAVPASVLAARVFAAFFELPFQRYRSWVSLREAASARTAALRARFAAMRLAVIIRLGGRRAPAPLPQAMADEP